MKKLTIVVVNGSLQADSSRSNSLPLLRLAEVTLRKQGAKVIFVSPKPVTFKIGKSRPKSIYVLDTQELLKALAKADGMIVGTGTHWGQSSSVLQQFIEDATLSECTKVWLGKPAGIIVSEHSTGGQSVLSNLMLTLSNYGCLIPPQAGMVYSRTGQAAKKHGEKWTKDVWGLDDVEAICMKVLVYAARRKSIKLASWPVDNSSKNFQARWIETARLR